MKKIFKNERDWKDLERADKIALCVGVLMWFVFETGCYYQVMQQHQNKNKGNIFKTLVIDKNR